MRQKVKRIRPQLLVIPERDRIIEAFRRSCTAPVELITMELERNETLAKGDVIELYAFIRGFTGQLRHIMVGEDISVQKLIGGAEMLAMTASAHVRRMGYGRSRVA